MGITTSILGRIRLSFEEKLPRLHILTIHINTILEALAEGKHISIFVAEAQRREYHDVIEVRQSRQSEKRWAYIPGRIPPGEYVMTFKHPK